MIYTITFKIEFSIFFIISNGIREEDNRPKTIKTVELLVSKLNILKFLVIIFYSPFNSFITIL